MDFPGGSDGKESACSAGDPSSIPESEKGMATHFSILFFFFSTPVFLPGESHGQRNLAGYSPGGHKESDTTERLIHTLRGDEYRGAFIFIPKAAIYKQNDKFYKLILKQTKI